MAKYRKLPIIVDAEELTEDRVIKTIEGDMQGRKGDMLITGVNGEPYPCKREIFEKTYEPADTCFVDICLDFDGVIHAYTSGWIRADVIPDLPVTGAIQTLHHYLREGLSLAIYSARSSQEGGIPAMKDWLRFFDDAWVPTGTSTASPDHRPSLIEEIAFPTHKPAAKVYIDDRGLRFDGRWYSVDEIRDAMKVWYHES